ncbi:DNRLRE domain-containing protein [Cellulomonas sp. H30R-01]|uniref:DNRLRE domain-containing protein n=1 Tax=Cellulomonas sp. H30R-01 TaxID=2704467 RepID=UPI00138BC1FA|nr:DNRLRE domain-containing protein [Cellulomonas sp. H30R-01]QHT57591.1 DNRLRE domain-containing protein [Cellulomonas sp. H30R-01]
MTVDGDRAGRPGTGRWRGEVSLGVLHRSFGVPSRWRLFVPVSAMLCAVGVAASGVPAAAEPRADVSAVGQASTDVAAEASTEPLTAPDVASARTIARLEGRPVEVLGERTEFGSVFVLPDGTMATGQGSGPVWVRQGGDGTAAEDWAPVDLSLSVGEDGLVRPAAHTGDLTFAGASAAVDGTVDLVSATDPQTGITTRVGWDGALPEPTIEGRRAVYADVRPGVDLVLEATATGFEQFFVLDERPPAGEAPDFPMTVTTDGAELATQPDGGLAIVDAGTVLANAPAPLMWDAESDQGRAYPVTETRPAEDVDAPRLSPMPAWVLSDDHGESATDAEALERAEPTAESRAADAVVGDGAVDLSAGSVEVAREVEHTAPNVAEVSLTPQEEFLQDPSTTYPVVVDPDINFAWGFDTYVLSGYSDPRSGRTDLQIGTYDGGAHVARSYLHFPVAPLAGKSIISARLELANWHSWSCQARNWQVWNVYPANTATTWANQPGWATHYATSADTHGNSAACPADWSNASITSFAQLWASTNETEGHVGLRAENESDNYGWKKFYSADNGAYVPTIWVTYANSAPTAPDSLRISGSPDATFNGSWTSTKTPRLSAVLRDPDGELVDGNFYIYDADHGNALVLAKASGFVPSGSAATYDVPAGYLKEATTYFFQVRGSDWKIEGPPSAGFWFHVDTIAPGTPTVTSTAFPNSTEWKGKPGDAAEFTIAMPAVDYSLVGYRWGLDKAPDPAQQVAATPGTAPTLTVTPKDAGRHVLQVQTVDRAGNVSGVVKYVFRVGEAGIVSPDDATRVVRQVRLAVEGKPELQYVSFQWRNGPDATAIKDIPKENLRTASGVEWPSPWQPLPTGATPTTTWDVAAELGYRGGPAQVRAMLSTSANGSNPTPTQWITVIVDPDADGAASTTIGPGSVNLLTGDHTLSVTDAEEFGLSLVRTNSSRDIDSGYQLQANGLTKEQQEASTLTGNSGTAILTIDTGRFHSGTTSYKVTPPGGNTDSYTGVGGNLGTGLRAGLRPGRTYRISAWIYVPESTGLSPNHPDRGLKIVAFSKTATSGYTEQRSAAATVAGAWQQLTMDYTVPDGAVEAFVRLYNGFSDQSKVVYYDDVFVQELWSPFGPEWSMGTVDGASGSAYTRISKPYDDVAAVEVTGGGDIWFTEGATGTWWPQPGAEALSLTQTSATSWKLTELDGTVTLFSRPGTTGDFLVQSSTPPGAPGAARPVYDVGSVPGVSRLSRLIAPIEPGVDGWFDGKEGNLQACTSPTPVRGCEVMELDYATTTTAVGSAVGSYTGRVSTVSVWTWNGTAMVKVPVASYAYNAKGQLLQVHDPRIVAAGGQAQVTVYEYDSDGRLWKVRAGGEQHPYIYGYGPGGKTKTGNGDWIDPAPGRLLTVTHAYLEPGTQNTVGPDSSTTTVKYAVPLTVTAGGPYNLDPTAIAAWAQYDGPTDATAVFDPLTTFAPGQTPTSAEYRKATVSYLNASGLEVNSAAPAAKDGPAEGFIDTAEYDARGNVVRTLDATNRLLALRKLPGANEALMAWGLDYMTDSRDLAQALDSRTTYSEDGLDVISTLGPVQRLAVANDLGDVRPLRARTRNAYDQGSPGGVFHLLTTTTTDGVDLTTGQAFDPIVTTNAYTPIDGAPATGPTSGWVHKQPSAVTVDAGQPTALTSTVVYDARGRAIRSSKPGSNGSDAGTTVAVFYTAGANPDDVDCGNRPEWAGQPCVTRAGGPVTGHDPARMSTELPVKRVTGYNQFGSPTTVSETVGSGAAKVERTSTTAYDPADRVKSVTLTATGPGAGQALPTTSTDYDPVTGDVTANWYTDAGGNRVSVTKQYDALGRLTKYTDATGAWTTTTYDRLGQPYTVTDYAQDGSTVGSRTYRYDRSIEPRGFVTLIDDSVAGQIVPTWGPDGQLESQTMPGGVKLTIGYDTARVPTSRTYTRASDGVVIAADSVVENHRGQWISHTTTDVGVQTYAYDRLGRLTDTTQTSGGMCTARKYGFDNHTNRTSLTTATGTTGAPCPTTSGIPATVTSTYDSADRLVSTTGTTGDKWTYDRLGRITAMPTADGSKVASTGYFVNDLVASQEVPGVERTTWTLDPLQRFSGQNTFAWVNNAWANSTESVNHYDGDGDEPSWIAEDITQPDKISRYIEGADGNVAVQTGKTGDKVLQLVDLHGDITATLDIPDGQTAASTTTLRRTVFDEFGVPQPMTSGSTSNAPPARYGWLGAAQRSADTPTGVILMGVRLYAPALGRFLQVDPVAGGSVNAYDYCNADPVNCTDLGGTFAWKGLLKAVAVVADISSSFIPGPVGAAVGGLAAGAYLLTGDREAAKMAAIGAAATLVGLGVVAGGVKAARLVRQGQVVARALPKIQRAAAVVSTRVKTAAQEVAHSARSVASIHAPFKSPATIGVRYVSSKFGSLRYLKLDKADDIRPYVHWVRGKIQQKSGRHIALQHYRWWGKKVH